MCDIDCINKISKCLKANPGKLSHNPEKIVTATSKNGTITGFSAIVYSLLDENNGSWTEKVKLEKSEYQCLVRQWIDYALLFIDPARRDRNVANTVLKELNTFLASRSYLVEQSVSVADLVVFYAINHIMDSLSCSEKELYINVSRWYDHLQNTSSIRQGPLVNFSTIHLV